jgi:hypothetical protein
LPTWVNPQRTCSSSECRAVVPDANIPASNIEAPSFHAAASIATTANTSASVATAAGHSAPASADQMRKRFSLSQAVAKTARVLDQQVKGLDFRACLALARDKKDLV